MATVLIKGIILKDWSYLSKFRDVVFVYSHLLLKQKRHCYHTVKASAGMWRHKGRSILYLSDFEELRNSRHSCQEPLVDLQTVFALASLHLEKFLWVTQITEVN